MSLPSTNETTTTKSANGIVNLKVSDNKKKLQPTVDYMLNPRIDLKYNSSQTQLEQFAIGQVLQRVGVNKMVNAQAMLENYNSSVSCLKDYYLILKDLNDDIINHNFNNAVKALFKVT